MNVPSKSSCLQTYQSILYSRALHPELFELRGRRVEQHGEYELEVWLMDGAHVLRFEQGTICVSELVTFQETGLPEVGVLNTLLCAGEQDFDHEFTKAKYMTTVQTEQLSDNLFSVTLQEMLDHAAAEDAMVHEYTDEAGGCFSMLDIQKFAKEIHVQAYHLIASGGVVLRTQTIFEHE